MKHIVKINWRTVVVAILAASVGMAVGVAAGLHLAEDAEAHLAHQMGLNE